MVANKVDLKKERTVTRKEGEEYANENNMKYIEMSCKLKDERFMRGILYDVGKIILSLSD